MGGSNAFVTPPSFVGAATAVLHFPTRADCSVFRREHTVILLESMTVCCTYIWCRAVPNASEGIYMRQRVGPQQQSLTTAEAG